MERLAVSTGTFIDLTHPVSDGLKILKELSEGGLYSPEIDAALVAAKELGIGLELAYRIGIQHKTNIFRESGVNVRQVHGPVVWSVGEAVAEGVGTTSSKSLPARLMDVAKGVGMALVANGTLDSNWEGTKDIAREVGAKSIVLHPNGAEILFSKRGIILGNDDSLVVGIEPDFRRLEEKKGVIWDPEEVVRIAEITSQGICLDTSHTGITYNSVEDMFRLYEFYKKNVKKGVVAVHFSVAIPGENREEFFTKGTGARPLYADTPDMVKGAYVDFYKELKNDSSFTGPIVLEMWSFPKGNSLDDRRRAVGESLNVLEGSTESIGTYK